VTDLDGLIEQLRARVSDPARRTDHQPGGVSGFVGKVFGRGGRRHPASAGDVGATEAALGLTLPAVVVRLYTEIADGGFGPGEGLLSLAAIVDETRRLRSGDVLPRKRTWPPTLIPVVRLEQGWTCVDTATGSVVDWDPEDLPEWASAARFRESFMERSPSVEAWLGRWVTKKIPADRNKPSVRERKARMLAHAGSPAQRAIQGRKAVAMLAEAPVQRAELGLPEEGWEAVVLGWYLDDDAHKPTG
jgi:hypothetical protein